MHSRSALEYATKGTYCDPHLQNRNVKLCSHQPSPKETIWFSGMRLDRLSNVSFGSALFLIYSAMQLFALFNHQQHSLSEKLCQLFFYRISQKNNKKKLCRTAFAFSWESAFPMAAVELGQALLRSSDPPHPSVPALASMCPRMEKLWDGTPGCSAHCEIWLPEGFLGAPPKWDPQQETSQIPPFKAPPSPTCAVIVNHSG